MSLLEETLCSKGLASIKRKILLHWKREFETTEVQRRWVRDCINPDPALWGVIDEPIGAPEILRHLSAAFGCGLWVNGRLCFENQVQIADPFPLQPQRESEKQVETLEGNETETKKDDKQTSSRIAPAARIRRGRGFT